MLRFCELHEEIRTYGLTQFCDIDENSITMTVNADGTYGIYIKDENTGESRHVNWGLQETLEDIVYMSYY